MARDDQLLVDAMGWLESDDGVAEYLEDAAVGDDIVVAGNAAETDADPRVFVGVSESSSERDNTAESKVYEVRAGVFATNEWIGEGGSVLKLTRLKARIKDVLTTGRDGWRAEGVLSDEEIAPTSDPDGYLGVVSTTYERSDTHAHYR